MDEWGVTWTKPAGGHFINSDGPFCRLDSPTLKDLEAFAWPDPDDPGRYRGLRERAKLLHETTDQSVVLNLCVGLVHLAQFVRGFAQWLEDLLANPVFAEGLIQWEFPRLCRGGSKSLTVPGVHPGNSLREPRSTRKGESGWTSMKA
jgi:uroporphyrinogen decarboxylase